MTITLPKGAESYKRLSNTKFFLWYFRVITVLPFRSLDSSVAKLRLELPSNKKPRKFGNFEISNGSSTFVGNTMTRKKVFLVIGINTAFSGRRRRDSIRETWMPRGSFCSRQHVLHKIILIVLISVIVTNV